MTCGHALLTKYVLRTSFAKKIHLTLLQQMKLAHFLALAETFVMLGF